ncbi:STAS domain-containing protein [Streptomyces sp. NPDC058417]|uniref:STAS domain-containing protein n=1 Tax=unclassified Streptomyces TaxID=2593676 RepID=UPI003660E3E7
MDTIGKPDQPQHLSVGHRLVGAVRVVTLHGEIDHDTAAVLRGGLLPHDDHPGPLRIIADFSAVTFMDSSGINVLVDVHQRATATRGWLRIAAAHGSILRTIELVGLDTLIPCHPTTAHALSA